MRTHLVTLSTAFVLGAGTALALPVAASAGAPAARAHAPADRIDLPDGWQPEGITTDGRKRLYAGSLATGAIARVSPKTGTVTVLPRSETGTPAVGIDYDRHRKVLWVAGGPTGEIRAHSARSGRLLATYSVSGAGFVNDLVVTKDAVYATDSFTPQLAVVPLEDSKKLPPSGAAEVLPLTGELSYSGGFNANGIVADHDWLVLVQSNEGLLFRVDPASGDTREIDLGGYSVANGDGLERDGDLLYVVRNQNNLIAALELEDDLLSGSLVTELTSPDFDVPTTAALLRGSLYAVNARFGNPDPANAAYWITRVDAVD